MKHDRRIFPTEVYNAYLVVKDYELKYLKVFLLADQNTRDNIARKLMTAQDILYNVAINSDWTVPADLSVRQMEIVAEIDKNIKLVAARKNTLKRMESL